MRLFIAEKPDAARAIALELGETGKGYGFIKCGNDVVVWCIGHMLELAEPDEYTSDDAPRNSSGNKIWRVEDLPIIPSSWILRPKEDTKKQLEVIGKFLKEASLIVNAGDMDREGQLLVDEVLEYFGNKTPVKRFMVSGLDSVNVRRGLDSLKDNQDYAGWADAARGRQKADWLLGMNLSRAFTLRAQRGGSRALLTVGRVQTPTLSLVVERDRAIESFKPIPYHTITASFEYQGCTFSAKWRASDEQAGLDQDGRLVDTPIADAIVTKVSGKVGMVKSYQRTPKKTSHPLVFSLASITLIASNRFGYSADDVLTVCQSLYEKHKLTTYPRTDCSYLPESQYSDASQVLVALKSINPEFDRLIDSCDTSIKSKTWDDSKVTAHHGIIPTMHNGDKSTLNDKERNIYELVVLSYLAQFYPVHEYLQTSVELLVENELFVTTGKQVTCNGWRDVFQDEDHGDAEEKQILPALAEGDYMPCLQAARQDAKTKPPSRFTEGTLGIAMQDIHKFVTDPEHKKALREGDGIGTPATRASIITELKKRAFLENKGKFIVSTELGRSLVDALPNMIKSPVLTALFERMLNSIEGGNTKLDVFVAKQEDLVRAQVAKANEGAITIAGGDALKVSATHKCKLCGSGLVRRSSTGKTKGYWWGCSKYPDCKQTYPDMKGQPDFRGNQKR